MKLDEIKVLQGGSLCPGQNFSETDAEAQSVCGSLPSGLFMHTLFIISEGSTKSDIITTYKNQ